MKKDLTGKRFGKLLAKHVHSRSRNGHIRWHCDCDCGGTHDVLSTHLSAGKVTHCGCVTYRGPSNKLWRGHGKISGNVWDQIRRGANGAKGRREIHFDLSIEEAWELFLAQNERCALSGLPIHFPDVTTQTASRTASLDRIDSGKGYTKDNVQWVHKDVNKMKNALDERYFVDLCAKIASHKGDFCP